MQKPGRSTPILGMLTAAMLVATPVKAGDNDLEKAGDYLQFLIPIAGLGVASAKGDWEGFKMQAYTMAFTGATVGLGKLASSKMRPHSRSRTSYPSGHTSSAFTGASFLGKRYGPWFGIPAYALAALTGYSRIDADHHFADDVVAGASIGMFYGWAFTEPFDEPMRLYPFGEGGILGVRAKVPLNSSSTDKEKLPVSTGNYRWSYEAQFGQAFIMANKIAAGAGGTQFDLNDLNRVDDPTHRSAAMLSYYFNEASRISLDFIPFESRDEGRFRDTVVFDGATFAPGQDILSQFRLYQGQAVYRHAFDLNDGFSLTVGAGLHLQQTTVTLVAADGTAAKVQEESLLPVIDGRVDYKISDAFSLFGTVNAGAWTDDYMFTGIVGVNWDFADRWRSSFGLGYSSRDMDTNKIKNEYEYGLLTVDFSYKF